MRDLALDNGRNHTVSNAATEHPHPPDGGNFDWHKKKICPEWGREGLNHTGHEGTSEGGLRPQSPAFS